MSEKNSKAHNTIQTQLRPGPQTATTSLSEPSAPTDAASTHANPDTAALKLELLASLRQDIADIFKKETPGYSQGCFVYYQAQPASFEDTASKW